MNVPDTEDATSRQLEWFGRRYQDAYRVARTVAGIGGFVKGIGVFIAILGSIISVITFFTAMTVIGQKTVPQEATIFLSLGTFIVFINSLFMGGLVYFLGVLIACNGQTLMASLDVAVNTSPFLPIERKAEVFYKGH